ncbi:MAG TPA: ShlB/FhaC/HecB family hemolysin secretion/activation protein [Burkholderiales bacterium]|nr:ShlB/FhaC/HecB family hemolysin secretion/activation protein [Burkholderiales bacterium]
MPGLSRPGPSTLLSSAALLLAATHSAFAQIAPLERPPLEQPALPGFLREAPRPGFALPPPPAERPAPRSGLSVVVSRFRVTGATVFSAAELEQALAPWTGRRLADEDLEEARRAITARYLAAGYVNSGAIIPDQTIAEGTLEIRVIEGRLAEVVVGGANAFRPGFIRERVELAAGPPLNVQRLQERMQVMLQNPQIERINAELGPGAEPGEAVLKLDVTEAKQQTLGFTLANNRSPAVGANHGEGTLVFRNKLGFGEALGLRFGRTEGLVEWGANLAVPVSPRDTLFTLKYERTGAEVIEPPFDQIDIRSSTRNAEAGLTQPLVRTLSREVAVGAVISNRDNASFLLGQPFSFTPGLVDGRSSVSALRLVGDWSERSNDEVLAVRVTASHGLALFGSTVHPGFPDSKFDSRLAQLQWARRLGREAGQVVVRADWQHANGSLLPAEKFAVGGLQSVRGYRENALVRDHGWAASIEYRRPVGRFPLGAARGGPEDGLLELAVFTDAGKARDDGEAARRLSSWGVGLRWAPAPGVLAQLYKGFARQRIDDLTPTRTLADRGVHFLVALQTLF